MGCKPCVGISGYLRRAWDFSVSPLPLPHGPNSPRHRQSQHEFRRETFRRRNRRKGLRGCPGDPMRSRCRGTDKDGRRGLWRRRGFYHHRRRIRFWFPVVHVVVHARIVFLLAVAVVPVDPVGKSLSLAPRRLSKVVPPGDRLVSQGNERGVVHQQLFPLRDVPRRDAPHALVHHVHHVGALPVVEKRGLVQVALDLLGPCLAAVGVGPQEDVALQVVREPPQKLPHGPGVRPETVVRLVVALPDHGSAWNILGGVDGAPPLAVPDLEQTKGQAAVAQVV
ncbi:unnamed protein product [Pseudo-nitzschia multistriata]|uniref:Uncharacterized protein n=1 Tax=Pseudo-nitzschia multistriata TaxID=183589 RepID=A0A448ZQV2_9STRA|nr:unnamed protein product [Pseudo-nitzschia multistriata]